MLNELAAQYHTAIIVVTHDDNIILTFKRLYRIREGKTHEEAGGREGRSTYSSLNGDIRARKGGE